MKNSDKILFVVALLACIGGGVTYALLAPRQTNAAPVAKKLSGAEIEAWAPTDAAKNAAQTWSAPSPDLAEGWNYDLFSAPEISWDSDQKKYFAKELPPPPEEVFGLSLKSLSHPKFRLVINSYTAGTQPVPESTAPGRYAAVLNISDISGARPKSKILNFGSREMLPIALDDSTVNGVRVVRLVPESPVTIEGTGTKLKEFRITQKMGASGFSKTYSAVVIDESGRAPREFTIGSEPVLDKNRTEAVFTDGSSEWRYSETRVPGRKDVVREIAVRNTPSEPFKFVESGKEIRIGEDVFRIKGLDISAQEARIEKQSSEVDKKTKAPKTTERVLSPER